MPRRLVVTLAVLTLVLLGTRAWRASGEAAAPAPPGHAQVVRVVDGDTMVVAIGEAEETVRLIGIDTPESVDPRSPVECYGVEAARRTAELVPAGTAVRLERDVEARDRYGRLLAYVHRAEDGLFLNLALVEQGYAAVATYPPNVAYTDRFVAAAAHARQAGAGLWSACPEQAGTTPTATE